MSHVIKCSKCWPCLITWPCRAGLPTGAGGGHQIVSATDDLFGVVTVGCSDLSRPIVLGQQLEVGVAGVSGEEGFVRPLSVGKVYSNDAPRVPRGATETGQKREKEWRTVKALAPEY